MLGGILVLAAAIATAPQRTDGIVFRPRAEAHGPQVRLGDVADLSSLPDPVRRTAVALPIAETRGRSLLRLNTTRVAERARGQVPILALWLPHAAAQTIEVRVHSTASLETPSPRPKVCAQLVTPLAAGAYPTAADLEPADCPENPAILRYDSSLGAVRARGALEAGAVVVAPPASALAGVRPGQVILLQATLGPVIVQRRFEAIQAARPGQALFGRADDGRPVSIPYPSDTP